MRLIVEAGSSKTDSVLIDQKDHEVKVITTDGINPVSDKNFGQKVKSLTDLYSKRIDIDSVDFYGSGCINQQVNNKVEKHLARGLRGTPVISVYDDLLGAARAMCKNAEGLACIIGTGSNIGYYDGKVMKEYIKSAGHLLGDEGSAYQIGRAIYVKVIRGQLSQQDRDKFLEEFDLQYEELVNNVYESKNVRTYLARFSVFIHSLEEDAKREILDKTFDLFVTNMAQPLYDKYRLPLHFCGSIGYYFQDVLTEKLVEKNIKLGTFVKSPIHELIKYYRQQLK